MGNKTPDASLKVESGHISGIQFSNGTRAFLGIPYAAPPIGDLRWRAPEPPRKWDGVRPATKFGSSSFQFPLPPSSFYSGGETDFSEDCLYLNVYTGSEGTEKRPVLVWFHFGAFQMGSASNPIYNGEKLAAEGITVVTVNYRLGVLGFLSHKLLSDESGNGTSGNYGTMDQIAALKWVQRNIGAFGGDASNVTIGGVSAGGSSVHILRASPLARGLFHKAICESGPGIARELKGYGHMGSFTSLEAAETAGAELLDTLGISSLDELRKTPAEKLGSVQLPRTSGPWESGLFPGKLSVSMFDARYPIVDGYVLPVSPLEALLSGGTADVPLLAGNAGNEESGLAQIRSLSNYLEYVHDTFGPLSEKALDVYPATSDAEAWRSSAQLLADQTFTYSVWTTARLQAKNLKSPVWYYQFLRRPPIPDDSDLPEKEHEGAFHCIGTLYTFGNLDMWKWDWTEGDRALSREIRNATVLFLKTGRPTEQDNVWTAGSASNPVPGFLCWDEDCKARVKEVPQQLVKASAFWDEYYRLEGF